MGRETIVPLVAMVSGLLLGGLAVTAGIALGWPVSTFMVVSTLAIGGPIVLARWLEHTGWLRTLPRTERQRWTRVLPVVVLVTGGAIGLLDDGAARDRAFTITALEVRMEVDADGRTVVEERIDVRFDRRRRGIVRTLPREIPDAWQLASEPFDLDAHYDEHGQPRSVVETAQRLEANRSPHRASYELLSATLDGRPVTSREERVAGGGREWWLGDPEVRLDRGTYRYVLRYRTPSWTVRPDGSVTQAETRIDVPGFDWATTIEGAEVVLELPGEVTAVTCVAGPLGSARPCTGDLTVDGSQVTAQLGRFVDHTGATLAVRSDATAFREPPPSATLPELDAGGWRSSAPRAGWVLLLTVVLVGLAGALAVIDERVTSGRWLRRRGADPAPTTPTTPTVQLTPPDGLGPVELAGVLGRFDGEQLLLASLVDAERIGRLRVGTTHEGGRTQVTISPAPGTGVADLGLPAGLLPLQLGTYDPDAARRLRDAMQQLTARARQVRIDRGMLREGAGTRLAAWRRAGLFALLTVAASVLTWVVVATTRVSPSAGVAVLAVVLLAAAAISALWWGQRPPLTPQGRVLLSAAEGFDVFLGQVREEELAWAASQAQLEPGHAALLQLPYAIAVGRGVAWQRRVGRLLPSDPASACVLAATPLTELTTLTRSMQHQPSSGGGEGWSPGSGSGSFGGGGGAGSGGGGGGGRSW